MLYVTCGRCGQRATLFFNICSFAAFWHTKYTKAVSKFCHILNIPSKYCQKGKISTDQFWSHCLWSKLVLLNDVSDWSWVVLLWLNCRTYEERSFADYVPSISRDFLVYSNTFPNRLWLFHSFIHWDNIKSFISFFISVDSATKASLLLLLLLLLLLVVQSEQQ